MIAFIVFIVVSLLLLAVWFCYETYIDDFRHWLYIRREIKESLKREYRNEKRMPRNYNNGKTYYGATVYRPMNDVKRRKK